MLALTKITRLIQRDPKDPGLHLAAALKGPKLLHHRQEHLLADLLHILVAEIRAELEHKPPGRGIEPVKKLIPRLCLASAAPRDQFGFSAWIHHWVNAGQPYGLRFSSTSPELESPDSTRLDTLSRTGHFETSPAFSTPGFAIQ